MGFNRLSAYMHIFYNKNGNQYRMQSLIVLILIPKKKEFKIV